MANENLFHVPFLPTEWKTVKNAFENRNRSTCNEALQVLSAWRLRSSSALPFSVQSSEVIIQAVLNDPILLNEVNEQNSVEAENVRLIYGMAITRFVNFITEVKRKDAFGGMSIQDACKMCDMPAWVVDLRHCATHGNLPSLTGLRDAIDFCWWWLKARYWNHELLESKEPAPVLNGNLSNPVDHTEGTASSSSTSWSLADDDVNWANIPIGLGPGQTVEDLNFCVTPFDSNRFENQFENQQNNGDIAQMNAPLDLAAHPPNDDEKRLEMIQSLIKFFGE